MAALDPESLARFARQLSLGEIGRDGQARILAATATVAGVGLAHEVAARYAERAGFRGLEAGDLAVGELAPLAIVKNDAARAVLAGARAAVRALALALAHETSSMEAADSGATSRQAKFCEPKEARS